MEEGNKTEESNAIAVITNLGEELAKSVDNEVKQLPKWKVDALIKFKDEHLGNLKEQLRHLKWNKKREFKELYKFDIVELKRKIDSEIGKVKSERDNIRDDIVKELKNEFIKLVQKSKLNELHNQVNLSSMMKFDTHYDNSDIIDILENKISSSDDLNIFNVRGISMPINGNSDNLNSIPDMFFELEYGQSFTQVKNQIITMEKEFKKALLFNNLVVAFNIYKEMEKADKLLDNVSKFETPKIEIKFEKYLDEKEFEKLEQEVEMQKKYEFVESAN